MFQVLSQHKLVNHSAHFVTHQCSGSFQIQSSDWPIQSLDLIGLKFENLFSDVLIRIGANAYVRDFE